MAPPPAQRLQSSWQAAAFVKPPWGLVLGSSHTQGALREEWALEWNAFGVWLGVAV
jgi:hypothetical protein